MANEELDGNTATYPGEFDRILEVKVEVTGKLGS